MNTSRGGELPAGLEALRQRLERWRTTHRPRARIPDRLWAAAVKLAGMHGIHRTARALRLDYYALKRRVQPQASDDSAEEAAAKQQVASRPAFVEWIPPAAHEAVAKGPAEPCECLLELEDAQGAKMRVHLRGVGTPDLAALSRSFWNPQS